MPIGPLAPIYQSMPEPKTAEPHDILLRNMPADLLAKLDAYTEKHAQKFTRPSRNATILLLLDRALQDAVRAR